MSKCVSRKIISKCRLPKFLPSKLSVNDWAAVGIRCCPNGRLVSMPSERTPGAFGDFGVDPRNNR